MNWRVWAVFVAILAATAVLGAMSFLPHKGQTNEPPSEHVTHILVDLDLPYQGTATVTYPEEGVSGDDLQAVVTAFHAVDGLLEQYYVLVEDPDDVRVRRRGGEVSMSFPLIARERLDFLFPEATLVGSWRPLWETLRVTILLPEGYEVAETSDVGFRRPLDYSSRGGRFEVTGQAHAGGFADFSIRYARVDSARRGQEE